MLLKPCVSTKYPKNNQTSVLKPLFVDVHGAMHIRSLEFTGTPFVERTLRVEWAYVTIAAVVAVEAYFTPINRRTRDPFCGDPQVIKVLVAKLVVVTEAALVAVSAATRRKVEEGARWRFMFVYGKVGCQASHPLRGNASFTMLFRRFRFDVVWRRHTVRRGVLQNVTVCGA